MTKQKTSLTPGYPYGQPKVQACGDDGLGVERYPEAEAILEGVPRVGKTPTPLFLALHCQVRAANYPLAQEDLYPCFPFPSVHHAW